MSPFTNFTLARRLSAFSEATAIAASLISDAVTLMFEHIFAREIPMAPLPQQRSRTSHSLAPRSFSMNVSFSLGVFWMALAASSTRVSVSWRGISTSGETLNVLPMNS